MQQILIMNTYNAHLRSEAYGWGIECGEIACRDLSKRVSAAKHFNQVAVGLAGSPKGLFHAHPTPLHALAKGWRLLAPPVKHIHKETDHYEWWFEKDAN